MFAAAPPLATHTHPSPSAWQRPLRPRCPLWSRCRLRSPFRPASQAFVWDAKQGRDPASAPASRNSRHEHRPRNRVVPKALWADWIIDLGPPHLLHRPVPEAGAQVKERVEWCHFSQHFQSVERKPSPTASFDLTKHGFPNLTVGPQLPPLPLNPFF